MTKAKPLTPKSAASTPKGVKNTSIVKNKTPKFKNTPVGKVPVINGTPKNKNKKNDGNNKRKSNTPLQSVTPKIKGNSPTSKPNTPAGKKNTPKGKSPRQVSQEELKKRIAQLQKVEDDDDDEDDSDDDVNEGVEIDEDVSDEEADSDDVSEDTSGIEGILGKSLGEDSDEDDEDFEGDEEEGDEENRGVKMFKGLKPEGDDDNDVDDDESEDEEEDDDGDDSDDNSGPGLKALLGNSLADDDDDEDFMDNEEDDEDEDISDEDEEEEEQSPVAKKNKIALQKSKDAVEEDDEDDEDDESETSKPSDVDEDDDDEENSEDEDDKKLGKDVSRKTLSPEERAERDKRTLFVGNVPKTTKKHELLKIFRKFGVVEAIRIRGVIPVDESTSKKVAAIKGEMHPDASCIHCFIRYDSDASARKALVVNGQKLGEHFLRVDISATDSQKPDPKKAVFLGNLPFKLDDNAVWKHFEDCGKIISVRVIRDRKSGVGKGFGYINFENSDSVALAMKLNGTTLKDREIRVKLCSEQPQNQKKQNQFGKRPLQQSHQDSGSAKKKHKDDTSDPVTVATRNSQNAERRKDNKQKQRSQGDRQRLQSNGEGMAGNFQGQKADDKKKPKFNKQDKKKKQFAAKLAAKPKKRTSD